MKRDTRTPTFWTSAEPPPMLPRGQLDLPLGVRVLCIACGETFVTPEAAWKPPMLHVSTTARGRAEPCGGTLRTWSR